MGTGELCRFALGQSWFSRISELAIILQVKDGAAPALQLLSLVNISLFFSSGKELKPQGKPKSSRLSGAKEKSISEHAEVLNLFVRVAASSGAGDASFAPDSLALQRYA